MRESHKAHQNAGTNMSRQNQRLQPEGLIWLVSRAEEILSPFIASLELCHPSVTKANVTAVLFEAALINSSPWYIMMIKSIEAKSLQPAARHRLNRNVEKRAGLTLTTLLKGMEFAN